MKKFVAKGLLLRRAEGGDEKPERQRAEQKQRGAEQQHQRIADERHLEPQQCRLRRSAPTSPRPMRKNGTVLPRMNSAGRIGDHHDLLERADLAFAHDGEGREIDDDDQSERADQPRHEEPAAVEIRIEPRPLFERHRTCRMPRTPWVRSARSEA